MNNNIIKSMKTIIPTLCAALSLTASLSAAEDRCPWGIAPGSEGLREYPQFIPPLEQAGVKWLRMFPEWQSVQPAAGEWNWDKSDKIVAAVKGANMNLLGGWCYFSKFASADGGTRKGPIKDLQFWRDYVAGTTARYKNDIRHWEVWNEFNGSFYVGRNNAEKAQDYAALTVAAYEEVKKIDPSIMVGISCANFDLNFFDAAIKAGAKGHFDFVCVHPYENLGALMSGSEPGFLALAGNLRRMLAANGERADLPLWITEIGETTNPSPEQEAAQAEALVKTYTLALAQGFAKVFWFEAMGPDIYGKQHNEAHGLLKRDASPRPAYHALKLARQLLGEEPQYLGWLNVSGGAYGFVFKSGAGKNVLVAWAPPKGEYAVKLDAPATFTAADGQETAGATLTLSRSPVFVSGIPDAWVAQAAANRDQPFPWGGDYRGAKTVSVKLGAHNLEEGIIAVNPEKLDTVIEVDDSWALMDCKVPGRGQHGFRVHPSFLTDSPRKLTVSATVRNVDGKPSNMFMFYESDAGYKRARNIDIPADGQWHELTWNIDNANFVGQWAYNFAFIAEASGKCYIKEIKVKKE